MPNHLRQLLSHKVILGTTLGAAMVFMLVGIIFWGGFHTVLAATNTMEFCISCHEMEDNVYQEYRQTVHYKNPSGVRATCPDCHVPKEWEHMIVRKITATNELFHKLLGTVDSPEKFNQHRLRLANRVWSSLENSDSRECRNCHNFAAMDFKAQQSRASLVHQHAQRKNQKQREKTCIDCHKGIAHKLPLETIPYRGGDDADHQFYQSLELSCYQCHQGMSNPADLGW